MFGTSISKSHPMPLPSCPGAGVAGGEGPGKEPRLPAADISCHVAGYQAAESGQRFLLPVF